MTLEKKDKRNIILIFKDAFIDLYNHIGYSMLISALWFFSFIPFGVFLYNSVHVYLENRDNPLNLLFFLLVFSIPYAAFILGPVQSGLLYQMNQVIENDAELKGLWIGFRKFYRRSAAVYGLYIGALIFTLVDVIICFFVLDNILIKFIGFILLYLFIFLLLASIYLPNFIVFQENTWKRVYKKTFLLTLDNTLHTIGVQLILFVIGLGFTVITPLVIFFYGSLLQVVGIRLFQGLMAKYPDLPATQGEVQDVE